MALISSCLDIASTNNGQSNSTPTENNIILGSFEQRSPLGDSNSVYNNGSLRLNHNRLDTLLTFRRFLVALSSRKAPGHPITCASKALIAVFPIHARHHHHLLLHCPCLASVDRHPLLTPRGRQHLDSSRPPRLSHWSSFTSHVPDNLSSPEILGPSSQGIPDLGCVPQIDTWQSSPAAPRSPSPAYPLLTPTWPSFRQPSSMHPRNAHSRDVRPPTGPCPRAADRGPDSITDRAGR